MCNQRDTENMITFLLESKGDGTIVNRNLMSKMLIHPKTHRSWSNIYVLPLACLVFCACFGANFLPFLCHRLHLTVDRDRTKMEEKCTGISM